MNKNNENTRYVVAGLFVVSYSNFQKYIYFFPSELNHVLSKTHKFVEDVCASRKFLKIDLTPIHSSK